MEDESKPPHAGERVLGPDAVARTFAEIADVYDAGSDLISFGLIRLWRRQLVRIVHPAPDDKILDICTGTGDIALALAERVTTGRVVGVDFSDAMLCRARRKTPRRLADRVDFRRGDATDLPLPDDAFDAATNAFGLRNVADIPAAWAEMRRVVRPGGRVYMLDLARPRIPVFRELYHLYFRHLLPWVARLVHSRRAPYRYLVESLGRFPTTSELEDIAEEAGLVGARGRPLFGGVVAIVEASVPTYRE